MLLESGKRESTNQEDKVTNIHLGVSLQHVEVDGIVGLSGDASGHLQGLVHLACWLRRASTLFPEVRQEETALGNAGDWEDEVVGQLQSVSHLDTQLL